MRKSYRYLASLLMAGMFSMAAFAQNVVLTGNVRNNTSSESVPAVSVTVKGSDKGTYTDADGNFKISVPRLPVTLVFTSIGYENKEVVVNSSATPITVNFVATSQLGQEVVVAATRTPQRILESPVTVERVSAAAIRNAAAPSYYEILANQKGVDMHTASLTFRTVTTRGFMSSGNTRLNQLIDGMDNQAPGLNFSVGSVIGLTELDVDNMELLSGASSALYGSGGMNGTLLINSKNPFKYQGFSFNIKTGVNHVDNDRGKMSPYYDWSLRYAKAHNRVAFKLAAELIRANDWQADDYSNVLRNNVISKVIGGDRASDPNYDGVNVYGDQVSANMQLVGLSARQTIRDQVFAASGVDLITAAGSLPAIPTSAQIAAFVAGFPAALQPAVSQFLPFQIGVRNGWFPASQNVSRTGYEEKYLVDYNNLNVKLTAGLHYKITPGIEASFNSYLGTGTTVYTGADRYSLRNLKMAQHKLEVRAKNWFVRGYTTQENAGDSYNATALASLINESWSPSATKWYPTYLTAYEEYYRNVTLGGVTPNQYAAHQFARSQADVGRLIPGTTAFDNAASAVKKLPIPRGALFLDRTDLWAAEAQLNLSDAGHFSKIVEVLVGGGWKQYVLNSKGTLFVDHIDSLFPGNIKIAEYGGYIQLRKKLIRDILTVTATGRYDKHTNFDGRFTPRFTLVGKVAPDNFLRVSYQTAYRFPTNQDQYINLNTGTAYLAPGILSILDRIYRYSSNPFYTAESISAYRSSGNPLATNLLVVATPQRMKPESVASFEVGYKGVINKMLLIDAYAYTSKYKDFLGRVAVGQQNGGSVFNPFTTRNVSYVQNTDAQIKASGWGIGAELNLSRGYVLSGNVYSDKLNDVPANFITYFNAPKYRWNLGLRNDNVYKNVGFNLVIKWQDKVFYEGTFVTGTLPSFGTVDGQISYRMPKSKSTIKLGGTNLGNNYYRTGFGSPYVGGLYYLSYGYNL
jgi:outer membrane receptor protein involved in Fe transport